MVLKTLFPYSWIKIRIRYPLCDISSQEKSAWAYWIYTAKQMIVSKQDTGFIILFDLLYSCIWLFNANKHIGSPLHFGSYKVGPVTYSYFHFRTGFLDIRFSSRFVNCLVQEVMDWTGHGERGRRLSVGLALQKHAKSDLKSYWSTNELLNHLVCQQKSFSFNCISISDTINHHFM